MNMDPRFSQQHSTTSRGRGTISYHHHQNSSNNSNATIIGNNSPYTNVHHQLHYAHQHYVQDRQQQSLTYHNNDKDELSNYNENLYQQQQLQEVVDSNGYVLPSQSSLISIQNNPDNSYRHQFQHQPHHQQHNFSHYNNNNLNDYNINMSYDNGLFNSRGFENNVADVTSYGFPSTKMKLHNTFGDGADYTASRNEYYSTDGYGSLGINSGINPAVHTISPLSSAGGGGNIGHPVEALYLSTTLATGVEIEYEPGSYYPIPTPIESDFHILAGIPVTALAFDETYVKNSVLYVGTVSKSWISNNNTSFDAIQNRSRRGPSHQQLYRNGRATLMATYNMITTSNDGTSSNSLYASFQSHPEANPATLKQMYTSVLGGGKGASTTRIPNHAYKPPYGDIDPALCALNEQATSSISGTNNYQMGVSCLIPIGCGTNTSPVDGNNILSVSPSSVRIHTNGGLLLVDYEVEGMMCGTPHPATAGTDYMTHVTVAGIATATNVDSNTSWNKQSSISNVQCLDIWQGLRVVSSYKLNQASATASTTYCENLAVTSLGTCFGKGCVIAGCNDGTLRLLDGRGLRENGKMKSHAAGVVNIAISADGILIATTGYGSKGTGSSFSSALPPTTTRTGVGGTVVNGGGGLHAFADPSVLVYDIRYIGRGGIPHPFAGVNGGPRYISFAPSNVGDYSNINQQTTTSSKIVVASGQKGGGIQIIVPFQDESTISKSSFIAPQLGRYESITSLNVSEDYLALGTSQGNILQYKLAGHKSCTGMPTLPTTFSNSNQQTGLFLPSITRRSQSGGSTVSSLSRGASSRSSTIEKQTLTMPPFPTPIPPLYVDASVLLNEDPNKRNGSTEKFKALFSSYILTTDPTMSLIGDPRDRSTTSFGQLATDAMIPQIKLTIAPDLVQANATQTVDFLQTVSTASLKINLFDDHHGKDGDKRLNVQQRQNPNKFIYTKKLFELVYSENLNRAKRYERSSLKQSQASSDPFEDDTAKLMDIPLRYRVKLRPSHVSAASFNHSEYNDRGVIPGWDYPVTMPNAFVCPILMLLYCIPEIRTSVIDAQFSRLTPSNNNGRDLSLVAELGFLFHRIDMITKLAILSPTDNNNRGKLPTLGAWAPKSFLSVLTTMPEAERLQILDGSPAAVASPRRPEAFYRFLMYHLDKEIGTDSTKVIGSLCGIDFVSVNQFVSGKGPDSKATTKQLTVELAYNTTVSKDTAVEQEQQQQQQQQQQEETKQYFGKILQCSLCRATELGAWNQITKSYDTIIQRKIMTSLPTILSLSPECAGCNPKEGLSLWQTGSGDNGHWLPEKIEIEIEPNGSVVVRELVYDETTGSEVWHEFKNSESLPESTTKVVKEELARNNNVLVATTTTTEQPLRRQYQLEAVVSMIRDDMDRNCPEEIRWGKIEGDDGSVPYGHHVVHVRTTIEMEREMIQQQINELEKCLACKLDDNVSTMTILGLTANKEALKERHRLCKERLAALLAVNETKTDTPNNAGSRWTLVNGFVVTDTVSEDARAFHVRFKEPSLIVFRAISDIAKTKNEPITLHNNTTNNNKGLSKEKQRTGSTSASTTAVNTISTECIRTHSLTNGSRSIYAANQKLSKLPSFGDLVAFDAEFVSVQEEESVLTLSGTKVTIQETRHTLARISLIDCRTRSIIFDDHVQPNEPVVDYLTRFSGIMPEDLHPKHSRHHLISSKAAYAKIRCFIERGCIFVGHGLQQDFWIANLAVGANQIVDTVHIYHKPAQRHISLRFLCNYILQRDMQQNVHDSIEDAMAALELYIKAIELKKDGIFDETLDKLYAFGQKSDWKLGVE